MIPFLSLKDVTALHGEMAIFKKNEAELLKNGCAIL